MYACQAGLQDLFNLQSLILGCALKIGSSTKTGTLPAIVWLYNKTSLVCLYFAVLLSKACWQIP